MANFIHPKIMFLFFFQGDMKPAMMAISNLATRELDPTTDDEVRGLYEFNQFSTLCLVFFKTWFPMFPCLIFSPFCAGSFLQYVGGMSSVVYAVLLSVSHLNFIMFFFLYRVNKQAKPSYNTCWFWLYSKWTIWTKSNHCIVSNYWLLHFFYSRIML